MTDLETNKKEGLGFLEILCLILITLKLIDKIDWGWGLVLLPWLGKYILGYGVLIIGWIWRNRKNFH